MTIREEFSRSALLLGEAGVEKLFSKKVAIFGVGGVGGYVAEALARSGIGSFVLIDNDTVSLSNINRQIIALHSTIGRSKVEVMKERILDINPAAKVETRDCFFLPENSGDFNFKEFDYVVDAVDTVTAKIQIIMSAKEAGVPVISSMGAGNKLDPTKFEVADIFETSVCPLARVMRSELKKRGVSGVKVVFSKECHPERSRGIRPEPNSSLDRPFDHAQGDRSGRTAPGSVAFVPSVAGLIIASVVVKELSA